MSAVVVLKKFREQLVALLDELLEIFPNDGTLYAYRFMVSDKIPMTVLMDHFISNVLPFRPLIKARDEAFFKKSGIILPDEDEDLFQALWESGFLNDDDKDVVWSYFDVFLGFALRYQEALA
jgi:hypothetical protein